MSAHSFRQVLSASLILLALPQTPLTAGQAPEHRAKKIKNQTFTIALQTRAFRKQTRIPVIFTCEGRDISPDLSWDQVPPKTQSIAILCEDPDAPHGVWTHWVLYNLPPGIRKLAKGVPAKEKFSNGTMQGKNDFGKIGYNGPCPPPGHGRHRYFFRLFALDIKLNVAPGLTRQELLDTIQGHVLGKGVIMGYYSR